MQRPASLVAAFSLAITFSLTFAGAAFAQQTNDRSTMALQGVGEVTAAPDMAIVTSGVVAQDKSAREALTANTNAMSQLIVLLQSMNIEPRDIQTSNFSVQPQYERRDNSSSNTASPRIDSYIVSNNVTVRVRDLEDLGDLLDAMVTVGANQIHGISFAVQETDDLYEQSRIAAVQDALAKAELYADAAGVELGHILSITESGGAQPYAENIAMARMSMDSAVPVSAGELTFSSRISITWELDQD